MANKGFNGTTVTFGSAVANLRGASATESCAEVNVTGSADAVQSHVAGIPKKEVSLDLVGGSAITAGSSGSLSISWFDGTTTSLGNSIATSVDIKGQMDGEITSSVKFTKTV
ncbi:MAG: hypothetical protein WC390_11300 [Sulfurimonas sp.]|jgi:hypothetical protein